MLLTNLEVWMILKKSGKCFKNLDQCSFFFKNADVNKTIENCVTIALGGLLDETLGSENKKGACLRACYQRNRKIKNMYTNIWNMHMVFISYDRCTWMLYHIILTRIDNLLNVRCVI